MSEAPYGNQAPAPTPDGQPPLMAREKPEVAPETKAFIDQWEKRVREAKTHWTKRFDKMRAHQKFVRGIQWPGQGDKDERYVCNITQRHIKQRVDAVYAKNPTVVAKRRPRLEFKLWDGDPKALQTLAMMQQPDPLTGIAMPLPEEMQMLAADIQEGAARRKLLDRVARTLELVCKHQLAEPVPNFKAQMKQCVRRTKICGVGYVKLGYQRIMGRNPEWHARFKDASDAVTHLETLAKDVADGEIFSGAAELEELQQGLRALQTQEEIVQREGLIFDFPRATQLIIDTACTQLQGFVGAHWLAHEFQFTPQKVKEIYDVDVSKEFTAHKPESGPYKDCELVRVWEIYDLDGQLTFTLAEGYCGYLKAPGKPELYFEQFHPFFALVFNALEDEEDIYPESDVETIRHMALEYNRSGESKRVHRQAARPGYVAANGMFGKNDKTKLANHEDHEIIELEALTVADDKKISDKLQPKPVAQPDPTLFETESLWIDVLRSSGDQEANFGGTSGSTATETTIAENSRVSGLQSDTDDLDEFLSLVARAAGHVLLSNMKKETVMRIAGPGAAWPEFSTAEMAEEIYLETQAGSSGRPNKALKLANADRALPHLLQVPGVNPLWLAKKVVRLLDDDELDLEEAILEGAPSITAINGAAQPSTGNPQTDPNAQGPQGGANKERPGATPPGPQPAFPTAAPPGPPGLPH